MRITKTAIALLMLAMIINSPAGAEETKPIILGLTIVDADAYNVEFQQYDRMMPVYRENGIQPVLFEHLLFYRHDCKEDELLAKMKLFHVVQVDTACTGGIPFNEADKKRAATVGRALARYVEGGGGLLLQLQSVIQPNNEDNAYWNAVLAPFNATILNKEFVFDKTRIYEGETLPQCKALFWHTSNIQTHPVTKEMKCLYLPEFGYAPFYAGITPMQYGPEWQVLVRGEKEAKTYRANESTDTLIDLNAVGTYTDAPPVLAVREFGKGRIVCYPISHLFTGMNHRNPLWTDIVETTGDRVTGQASDSMKIQMNAYKWLAEPSRGLADYGTHVQVPYKPAQFQPRLTCDGAFTPSPPNGIRGIFGAHSVYSDGKGSVAEYVQAAKAAGLAFIVFNDPLEKLTAETLGKLKADCAEASKAGDFYACPGIEFTDGIGNRWAMWGEKIAFPASSFKEGNREYGLWDGKTVGHFGYFEATTCSFPGVGLLDYKQLRANGGHPEKLWAFYHYLPFVYDKDRLIADNENEYLFGLRDLRWAALASFTRLVSPADVGAAAAACFTGASNLSAIKTALNAQFTGGGQQYISQGPVIAAWEAFNAGMANWRYTRGVQRVRVHFVVRSNVGIAEAKVLDADRGAIRRFLGHGAKEFAREFELSHDQQRYLVLEVTDTAGKKAISPDIRVYCYKSGLFRCGDNCNILGGTAMVWHPDRNEFFPAAKQFRNGSDYQLRGWDYGGSTLGVPEPSAWLADCIYIKDYSLPPGTTIGRLMDVGVNNYDLQIATMRMNKISETYGTDKRPSPYLANTPRDVGEMEYYERVHTLYAPMERVDMFVAWDFRRDKESRKDYRGAILWHEGEIRFKKDCTLQGIVPIPLIDERCTRDMGKNIGTTFVVTDADGSTKVGMVRDDKKPIRLQGHIRPGGYAAWLTTPVGYHGLLVPADMDLVYDASQPPWSWLIAGLGRDGQKITAGTVFKYRFGVGTFADEVAGNALLEHTVKAMNMGGGHEGYPVEMKTGTLEDAVFFFTAKAKKSEAVFVLGPQNLIIDLPIRVRGLENNGCAAIYSTARPWYRFIPVDAEGTAWLTESIDKTNEMWVGNVFACDNKAVKLTLVVDGQTEGKPSFIEVHNPTDKAIEAKVYSPAHAPLFGGIKATVKIPAGDSIRLQINGKQTASLN